jgi:hypothetical protein
MYVIVRNEKPATMATFFRGHPLTYEGGIVVKSPLFFALAELASFVAVPAIREFVIARDCSLKTIWGGILDD